MEKSSGAGRDFQRPKMVTCPYNKYHVVTEFKLTSHLVKCYKRHCEEQRKNGEEPLFTPCRFDWTHHVRKELLADHEISCDVNPENDQDGDAAGKCDATAGGGTGSLGEFGVIVSSDAIAKAEEGRMYVPYDREKRYEELKKAGYKVVRAEMVKGLSPAQMWEVYKLEKAMEAGGN